MAVKIFQFLSIVLAALCLMPSGAHLLELPNKIGMDAEAYRTAQQLYQGWALAGVFLVGAIASTAMLVYFSQPQAAPALLALAAFALLVATLVSFFVFILPVNQATENWTALPGNWSALRARWEYAHAANAGLTFFALVCVVLSALSWQG
jgi:hypothetical protein